MAIPSVLKVTKDAVFNVTQASVYYFNKFVRLITVWDCDYTDVILTS